MNWQAVRRVNKRASARKAKRERAEADTAAMHERLGGAMKVDELRSALREVRQLNDSFYTMAFTCVVWTLRGQEWRVELGDDYGVMKPHKDYRADLKHRDGWVPLTAGARRYAATVFAELFPDTAPPVGGETGEAQ